MNSGIATHLVTIPWNEQMFVYFTFHGLISDHTVLKYWLHLQFLYKQYISTVATTAWYLDHDWHVNNNNRHTDKGKENLGYVGYSHSDESELSFTQPPGCSLVISLRLQSSGRRKQEWFVFIHMAKFVLDLKEVFVCYHQSVCLRN